MLKQFNHRMTQQIFADSFEELMEAIKIYGDSFYQEIDYEVQIKTEFEVEAKNKYNAGHLAPYMKAVHTVQFYIYDQMLNEGVEPATLEDEEPTPNY